MRRDRCGDRFPGEAGRGIRRKGKQACDVYDRRVDRSWRGGLCVATPLQRSILTAGLCGRSDCSLPGIPGWLRCRDHPSRSIALSARSSPRFRIRRQPCAGIPVELSGSRTIISQIEPESRLGELANESLAGITKNWWGLVLIGTGLILQKANHQCGPTCLVTCSESLRGVSVEILME